MQYFHLCRKREDCEIMHTNTCNRRMFVWNNNTPFVLIVCKPNAFTDRDLRVCLKRCLFYLTVIWLCLFGDKQSCPWDRNHADVFFFFHELPSALIKTAGPNPGWSGPHPASVHLSGSLGGLGVISYFQEKIGFAHCK